jgi:hypothetical protein
MAPGPATAVGEMPPLRLAWGRRQPTGLDLQDRFSCVGSGNACRQGHVFGPVHCKYVDVVQPCFQLLNRDTEASAKRNRRPSRATKRVLLLKSLDPVSRFGSPQDRGAADGRNAMLPAALRCPAGNKWAACRNASYKHTYSNAGGRPRSSQGRSAWKGIFGSEKNRSAGLGPALNLCWWAN